MRWTGGKWEKQLLGEKEKAGIASYIRKRGSSQLQLQLWALWVHPKSGDTRTLLIINLSKPGHTGIGIAMTVSAGKKGVCGWSLQR